MKPELLMTVYAGNKPVFGQTIVPRQEQKRPLAKPGLSSRLFSKKFLEN
jgi:hypothetical protein